MRFSEVKPGVSRVHFLPQKAGSSLAFPRSKHPLACECYTSGNTVETMTSPLSSMEKATPPLTSLEARILGSLLEKEFCTPDAYPLSMNGLINACNQKNNRFPVTALETREVETAIESLRLKGLAVLFAGADARVQKFRHTLTNVYPVDDVARAVLTELLLRGPQTLAELKTRCERLQPMPPASEIEATLQELSERGPEPLTRLLPRQPGQKEVRWAQLLTGEPPSVESPPEPLKATVTVALPAEVELRLTTLEADVTALRAELKALRTALGGS